MLATAANAQVKCKMPNGVVVTRSMGSCPIDAVEAYDMDGKLLPKPSQTPEAQRANAQIEQRRKQQESAEQARINAELDARRKQMQDHVQQQKAQQDKQKLAIFETMNLKSCRALMLEPFQCKTDPSVFRGNFVVISTHLLTADVHTACRSFAASLRKTLLDGKSSAGSWAIRIMYSPTGATISECPI